jgi:hypothetical protein
MKMLVWFKKRIAQYDQWCERMGFTPENRRCCAPIRYDEDDERHPKHRAAHFQQKKCSSTTSLQNKKRFYVD